jgi:O-antigen ligase
MSFNVSDAGPEKVALPAAGVAGFLALMPVFMVLAPSPTGVLAPLMALIFLGCYWRRLPMDRLLKAPPTRGLILLALWGLASALWACNATMAASKALAFLAVSLPLLWLTLVPQASNTALAAKGFIAGLLIAAALLAGQTYSDTLLRGSLPGARVVLAAIKLNVPAAALSVSCWLLPQASAHLSRPWRWAAGLAWLLVGWAVFAGDGSAPRLGFIVGGLTLAFSWFRPRAAIGLLIASVLVAHISAPLLGSSELAQKLFQPMSWRHRMDIWQLAGRLIAERPLLGYGFGNSGEIPALPGRLPLTQLRAALPLYPHNVLLQAQLDLGILGAVAFYSCFGYLLRCLWRLPRAVQASGVAVIAAALSVWCVGYPLWRATWVAWLYVTALAFQATRQAQGGAAATTRPEATGSPLEQTV